MSTLITILISLLSTGPADGLRSTAPDYLTIETAQEHLLAATIAAVAFDVDRDILLSIGHHESRYQHRAVGPEAGGLVSCGVMTPEPVSRCPKAMTVLDGYTAGARHLRGWIDACRGHERCGLLGYAGGWRAIRACAEGPVMIRPGVDGCQTPEVFRWRAGLIRRAIARASKAGAASS